MICLKKMQNWLKRPVRHCPICSYCKKIRDDTGYWNQIEAYIKEHSEVDFSHSICPECAEKYSMCNTCIMEEIKWKLH